MTPDTLRQHAAQLFASLTGKGADPMPVAEKQALAIVIEIGCGLGGALLRIADATERIAGRNAAPSTQPMDDML